jgi:hypothetical protein
MAFQPGHAGLLLNVGSAKGNELNEEQRKRRKCRR